MLMCSAKLSSITREMGESVKLLAIFLDSGGMVFRPIKQKGWPPLYEIYIIETAF